MEKNNLFMKTYENNENPTSNVKDLTAIIESCHVCSTRSRYQILDILNNPLAVRYSIQQHVGALNAMNPVCEEDLLHFWRVDLRSTWLTLRHLFTWLTFLYLSIYHRS